MNWRTWCSLLPPRSYASAHSVTWASWSERHYRCSYWVSRRSICLIRTCRLVIIGASSGMGLGRNLISPVRLLGLGLTLGVGLAFFTIPGLVPRTDLPDAAAYLMPSLVSALGPVLGGVLVAVIGPGWTFGLI